VGEAAPEAAVPLHKRVAAELGLGSCLRRLGMLEQAGESLERCDYIHVLIYKYIYIYREREGERQMYMYIYLYKYIHISSSARDAGTGGGIVRTVRHI